MVININKIFMNIYRIRKVLQKYKLNWEIFQYFPGTQREIKHGTDRYITFAFVLTLAADFLKAFRISSLRSIEWDIF